VPEQDVKATFTDAEVSNIISPKTESAPVPVPDVQVTEPAVVKQNPEYTISSDDSTYQAVWKIMSDMKEYSVNDLALLLADFGFTKSQISPLTSTMFKNELVTRRKDDKRSGLGPTQYIYRLIEGVPITGIEVRAKGNGKGKHVAESDSVQVQANAKVQVQQQLPIASQTTEQTTEQTKDQPVTSLLQSLTPTKTEAPLLSNTTVIRGVEFSLDEYAQLYRELRKAGFAPDKVRHADSLVTATFKIKGIEFTDNDLNSLVGQMDALSLTFAQAIKL
jgi:hypothetical protein